MQVIPEHNQKALKVMKCVCVICECIDIYPYYPSHFQFKQHIIYQLCCQMLHVIVLSRKFGGRGESRCGEITIHVFPGELQSRPCFEFGGHLLFSSTPMAHIVKVEQCIKCKSAVQQGQHR